jgi:hypothetical protein
MQKEPIRTYLFVWKRPKYPASYMLQIVHNTNNRNRWRDGIYLLQAGTKRIITPPFTPNTTPQITERTIKLCCESRHLPEYTKALRNAGIRPSEVIEH